MTQQYSTPTMRDMERMDRNIKQLKAQAHASELEAKEGFSKQVKAIEDEFRVLQARIEKASTVGESVSGEIKSGLGEAWNKFTDSVERAKKYLH